MFTGLIEEAGECLWLRRTTESLQLTLSAPEIARGIHSGDSIAVNGCCLTVSSHRKEQLIFDLLEETVRVTNLGKLRPGSRVNLERALAVNGRVGGHFVQGHVDCTSRVLGVQPEGTDLKIEIELPEDFVRYIVWKGSICVNGVSLTVGALNENSFLVYVIPHTKDHTNLHALEVGEEVNLEFDILAKYAERILAYTAPIPPPPKPGT